MTVSVRDRSRLRFARLLEIDSFVFWDTLELPAFPEQFDDVSYEVKQTDRIDLLAFRFYGDATLWWVIAGANDMEILPTDMDTGDILRIPSARFVLQELFKNIVLRVTT